MTVRHVWISAEESELELEGPDHGLNPGDVVFLVVALPSGLLLSGVGQALAPEQDDQNADVDLRVGPVGP